MNHNQEEFYDITQAIQKDCHEFIDKMVDKLGKEGKLKEGANQDLTNIFLFKKLADIELRLQKLESANGRAQAFIGMNTRIK